MGELLAEMNNVKHFKRDSKSLTRYATTISVFVNDMEDNGCTVLEASEAPFFMSQLLSKLDPRDNTNFGREMQRAGKEENVSNLVTWLHQEATLRSRGKPDNENADEKERTTEHQPSEEQRTTLLAMIELLIKKRAHSVVRGNTIWLPVRCIKVQL